MDNEKTFRAVSVFMLAVGIFSVIAAILVILSGTMSMEISDRTDSFLNTTSSIGQGDISVMLDNKKVKDSGDIKMMGTGVAASGVLVLIYGILDIIRGLLGFSVLKGKNHFMAIILGVIGLLLEGFMVFASLTDGAGGTLIKILYIVTSLLYIYCSSMLYREYEAEQLLLAQEEAENSENAEENAEDENRVKTIEDEAAEFFK